MNLHDLLHNDCTNYKSIASMLLEKVQNIRLNRQCKPTKASPTPRLVKKSSSKKAQLDLGDLDLGDL